MCAGARQANVTVSLDVQVYERHSSEAWEFKKANVTCSNCGLYLGERGLLSARPRYWSTIFRVHEKHAQVLYCPCCFTGVKIESGTRIAAAEMRAEHTFADFGPRRAGCEIIPSEHSSLVGAGSTAASFEVERGPTASFEVENGEDPSMRSRAPDSLRAGLDVPRRRRLGRSGMQKLRSVARSAAAAVCDLRQKLCEKKVDWGGNERAAPCSPRRTVGGTLLSAERATFEVNQLYLGLRYLRMEDPRTSSSKFERLPLCCRSCGNVLSHSDQVLCTERRWGFRGVLSPEPSMYINSLVLGSTKATLVSRMALGQGHFDMCDLTCSTCNAAVGYRFCSAIDDHNVNHVGRAGLVLSCVHLSVDDIQAAALSASIQGSRKLNRQRSRQQPRTSHVQRSVTEPLSRTAMVR